MIKENPELLKSMSSVRAKKLKEIMLAFDEAKERNLGLLKKAISVNKDFVEIIRAAVIGDIRNQKGYQKNGGYMKSRKLESEMPALSFNNNI